MQYLGRQKRVLWYFPKWPISLPCKPLENATPQSKQVSNGEGSWCSFQQKKFEGTAALMDVARLIIKEWKICILQFSDLHIQ